ncbi:MAG: hypothetical protein JWQ97_3657 [Phenylobacterium sp.]|nr:hypothetical protein [Phenylobacterium sp.]
MTLYRPESRPLHAAGSAIIDFQAERTKRDELRADEAARHAACILADFRAGLAPFTDVLAALVAPFNDVALQAMGPVKDHLCQAEALEPEDPGHLALQRA